VQRIVRAYESAKPRQQELPLQGSIEVSSDIQQRGEDQPTHPAKPQ
jgi:hypothetical protein